MLYHGTSQSPCEAVQVGSSSYLNLTSHKRGSDSKVVFPNHHKLQRRGSKPVCEVFNTKCYVWAQDLATWD